MGKIRIVNTIKPKSAYNYSRRVFGEVKQEEAKIEGKKTPKNGMIQVSGLSQKREKKNNTRMAWLM